MCFYIIFAAGNLKSPFFRSGKSEHHGTGVTQYPLQPVDFLHHFLFYALAAEWYVHLIEMGDIHIVLCYIIYANGTFFVSEDTVIRILPIPQLVGVCLINLRAFGVIMAHTEHGCF